MKLAYIFIKGMVSIMSQYPVNTLHRFGGGVTSRDRCGCGFEAASS